MPDSPTEVKLDQETAKLLQDIYGAVPEELDRGIVSLIEEADTSAVRDPLWDQRDVVLITYADQVRDAKDSPLVAQRKFLLDNELDTSIRCVHLLPFCPYSSDDGFSVIDYMAVDPQSGTWEDIEKLGESFDLMFDLVLNHASQQHVWFREYLAGNPEYADFFIDQDPSADLSRVVRPRSLPLLTEFQSPSGTKHIWTTFSDDQVDLNYANPRVMLKILQTLVEYARRGARIIRLDAIAYLWKEVGTDCIHLPQTHAAVKLMRRVLDKAAPGTLVLTETNVPHQENISYFGSGEDEAHMVYQFSLPPLLLDAIHSGDTSVLRDWMKDLNLPSDKTTYFNFTASHDGIGVRPLEGIVSDERMNQLAEIVKRHGGRVNTRRRSDGVDSPYELNITYLDAVADASKVAPADHARRFLATQAIMLSMQGMPAVYFHSLVGTPNDQAGVAKTGQNRSINRHKYDRDELDAALSRPHGLQRRVFDGYQRLLYVRSQFEAFHPNASQTILDLDGDGLLGFVRGRELAEPVVVLANLTDQPRVVDRSAIDSAVTTDQLACEAVGSQAKIELRPFQVRWITS
mgnify:CR=1 FL=1